MKKIFLFLLLLPLIGSSQSFPDRPLNYITDSANVLSPSEEKALNHKLHFFQDSTSTQVFVYVAPSLNGQDLSTIGQEIFVKWDIGQKGKNNGVLIAIFVNDHKFRIHTGYGMEGILPDLLTKKIQDEEMRPSFKKNNYYEGIDKGIDKIIYYSKNEYKPATADEADTGDTILGMILMYFFSAILYAPIFFLVRYVCKEHKAAKLTLWIIGGIFFLIPFFGLFVLAFMLIIMGIIAIVKAASKSSGSYSSGGGSYTNNDNSWSSSSSSSDSSWSSSSSSDSDSSFSGGGGGDSGGGGSNSDW